MATHVERFDERPPNFIDRLGHTKVHEGEMLRHRVYTRFLHWAYGIFFFLALLSGFGIYLPFIFRWFTPLFGGGALTRTLHPWFGLGFVFFFTLQFVNWLGAMRWTEADTRWMRRMRQFIRNEEPVEPPDVGFFNGGQKLQFWEIVTGCTAFVITGIIMWFPEIFGRIAVAISYVIHDISALIMLFGIFFHLYQSTFGQPGTIHSMTRGTVTEPWAWTHHPAWYQQVTGRDPRRALQDATRAAAGESRGSRDRTSTL